MRLSVKNIRETCGYSIEKMAEQLNISPKKYLFYEQFPNYIPIELALKISAIGNIAVDYIFFG